MLDRNLWLVYVALAGLSWGTYVPLIAFGGSALGKPPGSRFMAILCVGVAYFLIGVLFPLTMFLTRQAQWPEMTGPGLTFASLAGVAGAVGAICVIFATSAAVRAATEANLPPSTYRLFIAPMIFGLAPVINTLVSTVWQPTIKQPLHFELIVPGWKLWLGIVLVGVGAALVLFSKEEAEAQHTPAKAPPSVSRASLPSGAPGGAHDR